MPSLILLDPGITEKQVNLCEKIVYDISNNVFQDKKLEKLSKQNFFKIGPLIIRLDYVLLFQYYFYPFDLVR